MRPSLMRRRFIGVARPLVLLLFMTLGPIAALAIIGSLIYAVPWVYYFVHQGYTWEEMDWNRDGHTSLGELFWSTEIGKREVSVHGEMCLEYFYFKHATPVKVDCRHGAQREVID